MSRGSLFVISFCTLLWSAQAIACQQDGKTLLWEDDFTSLDPSWGTSNAAFDAHDGKAILKVDASNLTGRFNSAGIYEDLALCITVGFGDSKPSDTSSAGVIFWAVDPNNYYAFIVDPTGKASVVRRQNGHWTNPLCGPMLPT